MIEKTKRGVLENPNERMSSLERALSQNGIYVPKRPDQISKNPRRWLLRGESDRSRLLDIDQRIFQPQFGQMGSYGVFLGDCLTSIMYYDSGAYYLFERDTISPDWLCIPSEIYAEEIKKIGRQRNLKIEDVGDGLMAESVLFHNAPAYQPAIGVATIPYPIGLDRVNAIFLSGNFLNPGELGSLPSSLREKITIL